MSRSRLMRKVLFGLVLAAALWPAGVQATDTTPTPLERKQASGLWTGVTTDGNGTSWIVRVMVPEGSGGTLRIGRTYGAGDALVSELPVDSLEIKRGRFQVRATSHDKNEAWHTVVLTGVGDFRGDSSGVAKMQATIRDKDGRALFQFATNLVLQPSETDFLAGLRVLVDRIEQMGKKQ